MNVNCKNSLSLTKQSSISVSTLLMPPNDFSSPNHRWSLPKVLFTISQPAVPNVFCPHRRHERRENTAKIIRKVQKWLILLSGITQCLSKVGYMNSYYTTDFFFPKEKFKFPSQQWCMSVMSPVHSAGCSICCKSRILLLFFSLTRNHLINLEIFTSPQHLLGYWCP